MIQPVGEVWQDHEDCANPEQHVAMVQVLAAQRPRLAMVVDENGTGQFFTTLESKDAVRWLRQVADDVERRGTRKIQAHLN